MVSTWSCMGVNLTVTNRWSQCTYVCVCVFCIPLCCTCISVGHSFMFSRLCYIHILAIPSAVLLSLWLFAVWIGVFCSAYLSFIAAFYPSSISLFRFQTANSILSQTGTEADTEFGWYPEPAKRRLLCGTDRAIYLTDYLPPYLRPNSSEPTLSNSFTLPFVVWKNNLTNSGLFCNPRSPVRSSSVCLSSSWLRSAFPHGWRTALLPNTDTIMSFVTYLPCLTYLHRN